MNRRALLSIVLCTVALCNLTIPARALINPNYTVVDLVRDSGQVLVLRVSAPEGGLVKAEVVEALVGEMPAERELSFNFGDAEELTEHNVARGFRGAPHALAVMCVQKKKQNGEILGALEIGTIWMGLVQGETKSQWLLDRDPNDLETVWGGSARQLIPAVRYTLSDRHADFPVASNLQWGGDLSLGKLDGPASGCLVTTAGIVVLSEGGDRIYRPGTGDSPPTDVTAELGLATKSKAATAGDFNGDGRLDFASWDGNRIELIPGNADGVFGKPAGEYQFTECCSLAALNGGLVVGTSDGVTLLLPGGNGALKRSRLSAGTTSLGPGGVCAVADFNEDGAADIVQVFARGLVVYAGSLQPGAFAAPVVTRVESARHPKAIVCGDYDADGKLDLVVGGVGGTTLLSRVENGAWQNTITETGELGAASGLGQGDDIVVAACDSDINGDGRQSAAVFHSTSGPGLFFSRGFACFGVALSLELSKSDLAAARALGTGQTTGTLTDVSGDLLADLLAVDRQQGVWVLFGESERSRRFQARVSLADLASGPLTVTAVMGRRRPAPIGVVSAVILHARDRLPEARTRAREARDGATKTETRRSSHRRRSALRRHGDR